MHIISKYWHFLSNIGVKPTQSFSLSSRVKLSNRLSFVNLFMGLLLLFVFSSNSTFNPAPLLIYVAVSLALPLVNRVGFNQLSRFIIAITPALVVLAYDINAKLNASSPPEILTYISPRFVITTSLTLPLTLFASKERLPLFLSVFIILFAALGFDEIYKFFGAHFTQLGSDNNPRYGFVLINVFIVVVIILSTFSFLNSSSLKRQNQMTQILKESESTNERLKAREAELKRTFKQIEDNREQARKQSWISSGLAEFARIMRDNQEESTLYPLLISRIIKYLEIVQGALFVIDENEEQQLKLAACYAYDKQQYLRQNIMVGEGLVGQAFKVQQLLNLEEIPDKYAKVASVLGEAKPKALLVVPLVYNGESLGVLELASFENFATHQIDFLQQLAEGIASTLKNINNNKRTQKLLDETQRQYEIIQAQEKQYLEKEQSYHAKIMALQEELEQLKVKS